MGQVLQRSDVSVFAQLSSSCTHSSSWTLLFSFCVWKIFLPLSRCNRAKNLTNYRFTHGIPIFAIYLTASCKMWYSSTWGVNKLRTYCGIRVGFFSRWYDCHILGHCHHWYRCEQHSVVLVSWHPKSSASRTLPSQALLGNLLPGSEATLVLLAENESWSPSVNLTFPSSSCNHHTPFPSSKKWLILSKWAWICFPDMLLDEGLCKHFLCIAEVSLQPSEFWNVQMPQVGDSWWLHQAVYTAVWLRGIQQGFLLCGLCCLQQEWLVWRVIPPPLYLWIDCRWFHVELVHGMPWNVSEGCPVLT